ncbi:MAG TPA: nucleoid-associated protein [Bacteroidia bacterium]|jgi:hypothetical protein|nr:nucleoid-associated protein [Bacteroidia bacterium]
MLSLENISLDKLSVHFVGNKAREEGLVLAKKALGKLDEAQEQELWRFFLSSFKNVSEFYRFTHSSDIELNEVRKFCSEAFDDPARFHKASEKTAKLLYECSTHAKIKGGELYVAFLSNCVLNDKEVNAIGLFKSETKDTFIQAEHSGDNYELHFESGAWKPDKACLIVESDDEDGFKICLADSMAKSAEAVYWKDDFLKIEPCPDDYHHTRNYMNVCKNFVTNHIANEFEISKTDQIAYLNKSVEYFKQNEQFNEKEFTKEVFEDKNVIRSFQEYKAGYQEENRLEIEEDFEISAPAVKKQAKVFKSVLKLDKNFHIYIHGRQDFIEKGTEKDGRKFYKIYYTEES